MIYDVEKHEELYQAWELYQLSLDWVKKIENGYYDESKINNLYAQAITLQAKWKYGFVMPSIMFYEWVEDGSLINYDGSGVFLDWEGNRQGHVDCNTEWLKDRIKKFPFVMWFNK